MIVCTHVEGQSLLPYGLPGRYAMLMELGPQTLWYELPDGTLDAAHLAEGWYAIDVNDDMRDFVSLSGPEPCPDANSALRQAVANLGGVYQEAERQP